MTITATPIPEHAHPTTWAECLTFGCDVRVDPWDHNIRCKNHRPDPRARLRIERHIRQSPLRLQELE